MAECGQLADGSSEVRARMAGRGKTSQGVVVNVRDGGHFKLQEELDILRPGIAVLMFRSAAHHKVRENRKNSRAFLLKVVFNTNQGKWFNKSLQEELKSKGFPERDFAYVHMCIPIRQDNNGIWYVIENAGGKSLIIRTLKQSFNDLKGDESQYMIKKTQNPTETVQRALAAYHEKFEYDYNGYGFNCEMVGSCCSGQFDKIFDQVLIVTPFAEGLKGAAENFFERDGQQSSRTQFLDAVLNYCATLSDVLGDERVPERHNNNLMDTYKNFKKETATQAELLEAASAYCQSRLAVDDPPLPAQCWPALLSSATVRPKGPNPLTRAQTMEKGEEKMIRLEKKRYSNLEIEGCRLMTLFRREDVANRIKEKKFELRINADGRAHVCVKDE